jgi:hypothetical protein
VSGASDDTGRRLLRWAWLIVVTLALLVAARMFRYAPAGDGYYWDRWKHRECEIVEGELDCTSVPDRALAQPVGRSHGMGTSAPIMLRLLYLGA